MSTSRSTIADGGDGNISIDNEKKAQLKASNEVKFCVIDENGNERRMTNAEKKAKKLQIARAKKEAKKDAALKKKRKLQQIAVNNSVNDGGTEFNMVAENQTTQGQMQITQLSPNGSYHEMPVDSELIKQELAEFQGKRGNTPPVILSPPMALHFLSERMKTSSITRPIEDSSNDTSNVDKSGGAVLIYDHNLSQEWAKRLKEQCVLPAEAVRQKEDLRPLAYRLQPECWMRIRPSLEETPLSTTRRSNGNQSSILHDNQRLVEKEKFPESRDWISLTCRPSVTLSKSPLLSSNTSAGLQHDDILSIVFEYIHRETPYYVSCGAKFGSDFLIYDGPRHERHAFAGLRVLSRFTNSMSSAASTSSLSDSSTKLPLPTAYSLTGFVRGLNTAGKLALLATVDEVSDKNSTIESESMGSEFCTAVKKKRYRVAFVDVALEKVLDVHKQKNRGRSNKKKLQKRRDVTQTLSKV